MPKHGELSRVQRELLSEGRELELAPGEELDRATARERLGFVLHGQLQQAWRDGPDVTALLVLRDGHWFGQNALLFGQAPENVVYRALGFTRVLTLDLGKLKARLERDTSGLRQRLERELVVYLAQRATYLTQRLHQHYHGDTETRVLAALEEATFWPSAQSHPDGTLVRVSRKLLAESVGCTRVTVSRVLGRLAAIGRVRLIGRRILLVGHEGRGS